MFRRIRWGIAASYCGLIALALFVAAGYAISSIQDLLSAARPLEQDSSLIGMGSVYQNRITTAFASIAAISLTLGVALAVALARTITQPIFALTRSAEQLTPGSPRQALSAQGFDETNALTTAFNDMTARLGARFASLEDGQARLQAVLDHMADGLLVVDANEEVLLINRACADLLGASPDAVVGRSLTAAVRDHELVDAVRAARARTSASATSVPEAEHDAPALIEMTGTGSRRTVQVVASLFGASSAAQRTLVLLQDVTELRRAEAVRREFVANVSHELRTPVASLKALVETLEGGAIDDPPAAIDFLGRMHVEVDGLAQMVEELLELSRIESGRIPLHLQSVDMGEVTRAAAERLRPQAERQGLALDLEVSSALPRVMADAERIQQVVVNLVHNAIKFTPAGGRIRVTAEPGEEGVIVSVSDTGIGIGREALNRLFERFYKEDRARSTQGTGLGLAIAKHLVQAHGGRIWAESEGEGRGAQFSFFLGSRPTTPATESKLR